MKGVLKVVTAVMVLFGIFYGVAIAAVAESENNARAISNNTLAIADAGARFRAGCYSELDGSYSTRFFSTNTPELQALANSGQCYVTIQ